MRLLVLAAVAAAALLAGGVDGRWKGTADSGTEIVLNLQSDVEKLTGTVALNRAPERPVSDGKVEGARISFAMPSMYGAAVHQVRGELKGGELEIRIESESLGSTTVRLKRE